MTSAADTAHVSAFPGYPGARSAQCPYEPPAEYAERGRSEGLWQAQLPDGASVWVVSRHEDVRAVLSDPRISADSRNPNLPGAKPGLHSFARLDDPEHARLRRPLVGAFSPRRMAALRPRIQDVVDRVLDEMINNAMPADLVREYALPIPSLVICLLLGVPYEDHEFFQSNSATLIGLNVSPEEKMAAGRALIKYLYDLTERKRINPADDIVSHQARQVGSGELTREEAATNCATILIAGHETTSSMIAMGALVLLRHPDQAAPLREADPGLIVNTVEELLRYLSVAELGVVRVATEDVTVGGQLVRTGEGLVMCLPAANRDAEFFDRPPGLDIDRDARGHLAFGYGVHQCLGQSLARAELQIALGTLLRRLPDLRMAMPVEQVRLRPGSTIGIRELPVVW